MFDGFSGDFSGGLSGPMVGDARNAAGSIATGSARGGPVGEAGDTSPFGLIRVVVCGGARAALCGLPGVGFGLVNFNLNLSWLPFLAFIGLYFLRRVGVLVGVLFVRRGRIDGEITVGVMLVEVSTFESDWSSTTVVVVVVVVPVGVPLSDFIESSWTGSDISESLVRDRVPPEDLPTCIFMGRVAR